MSFLVELPDSGRFEHEMRQWRLREVGRFYVQQRRRCCSFLEVLELWMTAPYCEECAFARRRGYRSDEGYLPDSMPSTWETDLEFELGDRQLVDEISQAVNNGDVHGPSCHSCGRMIFLPEENMYVVDHPVEYLFEVPGGPSGCRSPSKRLRKQIFDLYDRQCFKCGDSRALHIDHIVPRSQGGDTALQNLQPLCDACGQAKADADPTKIVLTSTMYFREPPSDSFEGMFW